LGLGMWQSESKVVFTLYCYLVPWLTGFVNFSDKPDLWLMVCTVQQLSELLLSEPLEGGPELHQHAEIPSFRALQNPPDRVA